MAYLLIGIPIILTVYYKCKDNSLNPPTPISLTRHNQTNQTNQTNQIHTNIFDDTESFTSKKNLEFLRKNAKYKNMSAFVEAGGISSLNKT